VLRERLVTVSDHPKVDLFVAEVGDVAAEPLLVIHGGPDWDQSYLYEPLVRLQDRRRVVFVDLRGCGRSTRGLPRDAYTPEAATRDLVALVAALTGDPLDVLGFSYGGLLAQRLTLTAPERVRRLVVASSSVIPVPADAFDGWDARNARLASQDSFDAPDEWDDDATRLDATSSARANIWRLELLPDYLDRLERIRFSSDWSASWLGGSLPSARLDDAPARLAQLGKPILLLHGRQDMTFPASLVAPTVELIPTARAAVIEEAGHMAHVDQPEAWLAALRGFLDGGARAGNDPGSNVQPGARRDPRAASVPRTKRRES